MKDQDLNKYYLLTRQVVSAYNYNSRDTGRFYHTKGKSDTSYMFLVGCVFIDHASCYVSTKNQVDISATKLSRKKSPLR